MDNKTKTQFMDKDEYIKNVEEEISNIKLAQTKFHGISQALNDFCGETIMEIENSLEKVKKSNKVRVKLTSKNAKVILNKVITFNVVMKELMKNIKAMNEKYEQDKKEGKKND